MTNQEIFDKCKAKAEAIVNEINTTPKGWELWLMVRDGEVDWTTQTENTRSTGPVFSKWSHQHTKKVDWGDIAYELWMDLYNSRGDN